ncbi:MAG: NAD(P)-binding protein [Acidobacteriaceae bacterium]|nr:NAD(P)-binding protein [Acidobacteriaceae bacterium]
MPDNKTNDTPLDRILGLDQPITRQDFLNSALLASGAVLAGKSPLDLVSEDNWTGYGGVGDYSHSNGNTYEVVTDGHKIRDHVFHSPTNVRDRGEEYDCVIAGGGISGMAAALFFQRGDTSGERRCLVLDNHPIFGGEAKRNEFDVDGQRIVAHQGSAMCFPPLANTFLADFYSSIGIDWSQFQYQSWNSAEPELPVGRTSYIEDEQHTGFYFGAKFGRPEGLMLVDAWGKNLDRTPVSEAARRDMQRMKASETGRGFTPPVQHGDAISRHLDQITLEQHICDTRGISRETVRTFLSPVTGGGSGLGADALSAYADYAADVLFPWDYAKGAQMFPGGNAGIARHILKHMLPEAIPGPATVANICRAPIQFSALDRDGSNVRLRMRTTVVSVEHDSAAKRVRVTYLKGGRLHQVRARSVIMAGGSWTTKHIVRDLPTAHRQAFAQFHRSPCLMANVAVRNWRFLYKLGISGCQWYEGIGNYCAVRRSPLFGPQSGTINPDRPVVLTLKILFSKPGLPIDAQTSQGRSELLATPFREYERQIREQFTQMFARSGFDARRDMAGIILNRWGHAYLSPQPGFFFGNGGNAAPGDFLRSNPFGRIAFANSDLAGIMDHRASIVEARRAVSQMLV